MSTELYAALKRADSSHDVGEEIVFLVRELVETAWSLGPQQRTVTSLLILAAFVASRRGSTRLPLGGGVNGPLGKLIGEIITATRLDITPAVALREIQRLIKERSLDDLFGRPGEYRPLILDDGFVYLHKFHHTERQVARALAARIKAEPKHSKAKLDLDPALSDEQRHAVELATSRALSVVTGGPGTGKTFIIVSIVRALTQLGFDVKDIALAAPTGKAAQRMSESVGDVEARTIHRLLGYGAANQRFRHHENNPLRCRALIIDEASMIDLHLMERLLRAIPADTLVTFLGDVNQLPSVDAGAVMRDLCDSDGSGAFVARLSKNYRMNESNVLRVAADVVAGDPKSVQSIIDESSLDAFVSRWAGRCNEPGFHDRARLLSATRRGPAGTEALNRMISRALGTYQAFLPGFPVIVRKNDYQRELFNGDQGLIVGHSPSHRDMTVEFRRPDGVRSLPLPAIEHLIDPAFALTVHQSQGSEFDEIALILPPKDTSLLTRELVYTAITRARSRATIVAAPDVAKAAIRRTAERYSALRDHLR